MKYALSALALGFLPKMNALMPYLTARRPACKIWVTWHPATQTGLRPFHNQIAKAFAMKCLPKATRGILSNSLSFLVLATVIPYAIGFAQVIPDPLTAGPKVTLEVGARPLHEVIGALASKSGLPLDVDQALQDDKVSLRLTSTSFPIAVKALAYAVDGVWRVRQLNGVRRYVLAESEQRKKIHIELRQRLSATEARLEQRLIDRLGRNLAGQERP